MSDSPNLSPSHRVRLLPSWFPAARVKHRSLYERFLTVMNAIKTELGWFANELFAADFAGEVGTAARRCTLLPRARILCTDVGQCSVSPKSHLPIPCYYYSIDDRSPSTDLQVHYSDEGSFLYQRICVCRPVSCRSPSDSLVELPRCMARPD